MEAIDIKHVECTPGVCGGAPRVAGTRIRVSQLALLTEQGWTPDEIVASYQHLTLADVHAALAYYHDHRERIDSEIRHADAEYEKLRRPTIVERQEAHGAPLPS